MTAQTAAPTTAKPPTAPPAIAPTLTCGEGVGGTGLVGPGLVGPGLIGAGVEIEVVVPELGKKALAEGVYMAGFQVLPSVSPENVVSMTSSVEKEAESH